MDIVLKRFVEGMSIPNIVQYLEREWGMKVGRDVPYQDIARATNKRWLQYTPSRTVAIGQRLIDLRKELLDVYVPDVGERMPTVNSAANLCASAVFNIAKAKAIGIALGNAQKNIPHWSFPVKVHRAGSDQPVRCDFKDVDVGEAEDGSVEPDPMRLTIRIGFSGGNTMALASRDLAGVIAARIEDWEKDLKTRVIQELHESHHDIDIPTGIIKRRFQVLIEFVFVNLNSGFDRDPRTNPIAFLSGLRQDPILADRTRVEIFNAMPFVEVGKCRETIREIAPLREVREDFDKHGFDIILTSGGSFDDPHSTYRRYYRDPRVQQLLASEKVLGDFMWLPVTKHKPFRFDQLREKVKGDAELQRLLKYQPMTLLDLDDVADHVAKKRDVFCVLAPCGVCGLEKSGIANALLNQERGLVTHLILDRATADATVQAL